MLPTTTPGTRVDFRFEILATDISGRTHVLLDAAAVRRRGRQPGQGTTRSAARTTCRRPSRAARRRSAAPRSASHRSTPAVDKGDPNLPTQQHDVRAPAIRRLSRSTARTSIPRPPSAAVGIRPLQKLLGQPDAVADVAYPQVFKDHGFGEADASKNKGKLFLQLIDQPHKLEFGGSGRQERRARRARRAADGDPRAVEGHGAGRRAGAEARRPRRSGEDRAGARQGRRRRVQPDRLLLGRDDPRRRQALGHPRDRQGPRRSPRSRSSCRASFADRVEASFDWTTTIDTARPAEARHAAGRRRSRQPADDARRRDDPDRRCGERDLRGDGDARATSRSTSSASSSCGSTS